VPVNTPVCSEVFAVSEVERDALGRFQPGASGNPGGRPRRDEVVRRLAGRRGGEAVRLLCELLLGAGVIVIDARGVLVDLVARHGAAFDPGVRPAVDPVLLARRDARAAAEAAFVAGWVRESQGERWVYRHRETGEVIGEWERVTRLSGVLDAAEASILDVPR
jgi:hypothetical protein